MPLPARYLATKLAEPLPSTDGGVLSTVGDAITGQLSLALLTDAKLDLGAKRAPRANLSGWCRRSACPAPRDTLRSERGLALPTQGRSPALRPSTK
jgi:hypothetical protein